jgi:2-polyprenyl-6-methoxyphenol hydroxylase-like FAD-dependent oxidoreductase
MNNTETPVLIAGAGPTGLALALWLARLGVKARIVDRNAGPADYSRALGVQPRTLEFYRQLGFAEEAVAGGVEVAGVNFWAKGHRRARVPFGRMGEGLTPFPYIVDFAQNDHERLLIAQLESAGVTVERSTELLGFSERPDGVEATLRRPDGSEEVCRAAYIVGCDGAHSTVRETLGIGLPGGTYSHLFYVADVVADGPVVNGDIHIDLDAADLLAVFPMKGAGHIRLVGTVREEPGEEITFEDVAARPIRQLQLDVRTVNWFSTYRVHHRVAEHFRAGRAFLLGDAAHIHSPVGAQGMNTGIGDAVNLAWKLASVLDGTASETLLDTYEPERRAFALGLVRTTDRVFTIASRPGAFAAFVRTAVIPIVVPFLMRLGPFRRWMFRTVSQLGLQYRNSRLSEGEAGAVRGGDRLPWVPGLDNFAPLASLAWQAHAYGDALPDLLEGCAMLGVPLHVFAWTPEAARAGLAENALYLIRPDGYVALADPKPEPRRLAEYLAGRGIACSPQPASSE